MNSQPMSKPRMSRWVKVSGWLLLAGAVLSALLITAALQSGALVDGASIVVNGKQLSLDGLHGGQRLLALGGMLLALVAMLLVIPFAMMLSLLCAALGIALALCAVLGVTVLLLSPLLLVVWVVWRLARGRAATHGPDAVVNPNP